MKWCVQSQVDVTPLSSGRRSKFRSDVEAEVVKYPRWGKWVVKLVDSAVDPISKDTSARFDTEADADATYNMIVNEARRLGLTGWVRRHACTHDESNPQPCGVDVETIL